MAELEIKGKKTYIKRMYKHLRKEHPSTKKRMTIDCEKKKKTRKKRYKMVLKPFGYKFK